MRQRSRMPSSKGCEVKIEPATVPPIGAKVKLLKDGPRWWAVRAADERFAILTRQADFKPKGEVLYTILDVHEGVRGPCNLIGQGWDRYMPDTACQELLEALQVGAKVNAWNAGDRSFDLDAVLAERQRNEVAWVEISRRNRVALDLGEVRRPAAGVKQGTDR